MRFDVLETNYCREALEVALNAFGICTGLVTALDHEIFVQNSFILYFSIFLSKIKRILYQVPTLFVLTFCPIAPRPRPRHTPCDGSDPASA